MIWEMSSIEVGRFGDRRRKKAIFSVDLCGRLPSFWWWDNGQLLKGLSLIWEASWGLHVCMSNCNDKASPTKEVFDIWYSYKVLLLSNELFRKLSQKLLAVSSMKINQRRGIMNSRPHCARSQKSLVPIAVILLFFCWVGEGDWTWLNIKYIHSSI